MTPFVADASITLAWFVLDEATPYTASLRARLRTTTAVVPAIWAYEVINALTLARRRNRMTDAELEHALRLVDQLPIEIEAVAVGRVSGAVASLAAREHLTVYDAAYLEVAMRRGFALATLDARLRVAAERVGVPLTAPRDDGI